MKHIPNILTIFRLLACPLIIYLFIFGTVMSIFAKKILIVFAILPFISIGATLMSPVASQMDAENKYYKSLIGFLYYRIDPKSQDDFQGYSPAPLHILS